MFHPIQASRPRTPKDRICLKISGHYIQLTASTDYIADVRVKLQQVSFPHMKIIDELVVALISHLHRAQSP